MEIVQGKREDIHDIERLYDDVNDFLADNTNYPGWSKGVYPTIRDAENSINNESHFIAKVNNTIIGSIILNHEPEKGFDDVKWLTDNKDYTKIMVIHTLAVHPNYLRKGVGQALLDFALRFAKSKGMESIRLDTYEGNIPAIKLYEKNNYIYIGTVDIGFSQYGLDAFKLFEFVIQ